MDCDTRRSQVESNRALGHGGRSKACSAVGSRIRRCWDHRIVGQAIQPHEVVFPSPGNALQFHTNEQEWRHDHPNHNLDKPWSRANNSMRPAGTGSGE